MKASQEIVFPLPLFGFGKVPVCHLENRETVGQQIASSSSGLYFYLLPSFMNQYEINTKLCEQFDSLQTLSTLYMVVDSSNWWFCPV